MGQWVRGLGKPEELSSDLQPHTASDLAVCAVTTSFEVEGLWRGRLMDCWLLVELKNHVLQV